MSHSAGNESFIREYLKAQHRLEDARNTYERAGNDLQREEKKAEQITATLIDIIKTTPQMNPIIAEHPTSSETCVILTLENDGTLSLQCKPFVHTRLAVTSAQSSPG